MFTCFLYAGITCDCTETNHILPRAEILGDIDADGAILHHTVIVGASWPTNIDVSDAPVVIIYHQHSEGVTTLPTEVVCTVLCLWTKRQRENSAISYSYTVRGRAKSDVCEAQEGSIRHPPGSH